jgi:6,7-dimethyl-8-ribityllumazine synthase
VTCSNHRVADSTEATDLTIAVLVARTNEAVARRLLRGAEESLKTHGVEETDVYWVPSPFDIPVIALALAEKGGHDAIVALGSVIGDEVAATQVASGLMQVQLDTGVPISFGVLATDDDDQALARSGPKNNAGAEAAEGAIEMAKLLRELQG